MGFTQRSKSGKKRLKFIHSCPHRPIFFFLHTLKVICKLLRRELTENLCWTPVPISASRVGLVIVPVGRITWFRRSTSVLQHREERKLRSEVCLPNRKHPQIRILGQVPPAKRSTDALRLRSAVWNVRTVVHGRYPKSNWSACKRTKRRDFKRRLRQIRIGWTRPLSWGTPRDELEKFARGGQSLEY